MWGFESVTPRLIHGLCGNTKLNFSIKTDPSRSEWRQRNMSGVCALTRIHLAQGPGILCTFYIMGLIFTPRFRFALGYGVTLPHPMHAILYCRKLSESGNFWRGKCADFSGLIGHNQVQSIFKVNYTKLSSWLASLSLSPALLRWFFVIFRLKTPPSLCWLQ